MLSYIQRLQDFRTRVARTDSNRAASAWIAQRLSSWGCAAAYDTVPLDSSNINGHPWTGNGRNVVGTITDARDPSRAVIAGGHFDSAPILPVYGSGDTTLLFASPGADDNASGTAGTMEIARIFGNHQWNYTTRFMGFDAEEAGLLGSEHYAAQAESNAVNIQAVINMDMIGDTNGCDMRCEALIVHDDSRWLGHEHAAELLTAAGHREGLARVDQEVVAARDRGAAQRLCLDG